MLFDARAALSEILSAQHRPATIATIATNRLAPAHLSQVSRLSQPAMKETANPTATNQVLLPEAAEIYTHGCDINGNPKTWIGRSVPPLVWRALTDWERHGSTGQFWSGLSRSWGPAASSDREGKRNGN